MEPDKITRKKEERLLKLLLIDNTFIIFTSERNIKIYIQNK